MNPWVWVAPLLLVVVLASIIIPLGAKGINALIARPKRAKRAKPKTRKKK